jgi:HAD superfamily hydrolase (TIGR01459 family)
MRTTKFLQGISDISDSYTGFIIDTWGVLHNGKDVSEGVIDCLRELKARKKFVLILSNTINRNDVNANYLSEIGITSDLYSKILTSGEMVYQGLTEQKDNGFEQLGKECFLIGGERTKEFLKQTDVEIVSNISDASFILISGWDTIDHTKNYDDVLREAVRRKLKAVYINPDSRALQGIGYTTGTGAVASRYQEMAGVVHYIGKPYKPIFHYSIKILHEHNIYPGQTVMIGDTMAHDILGASLVNMDTCLVRSGMHAPAFKGVASPAEANKILNRLVEQYNQVRPTYLVDRLKWGKILPDRKHKKRNSNSDF